MRPSAGSEWDTVAPVVNGGIVEVTPPTLEEVLTSNEIMSEIAPRRTQSTASDDCLYCASLAQEMHRRAVPMAEVIQTYAEIDVAISCFHLRWAEEVFLPSASKLEILLPRVRLSSELCFNRISKYRGVWSLPPRS